MKLLFPNKIFEKSFYFVSGKKSLVEISEEVGVPPHFIIRDNSLKAEPQSGDCLIIIKRASLKIVDVEFINSLTKVELANIKSKNDIDYLFVGQYVSI